MTPLAGSSLSYKHTKEAKLLISQKRKGINVMSPERLAYNSLKYSGKGNPFYGKTYTEVFKERLKKARSKSVYVYSASTLILLNSYSETKTGAESLNLHYSTILKYIKLKIPYKGKLYLREQINKEKE